MVRAPAVVVPRGKGEVAIQVARFMDLMDHSLRIHSAGDELYIPLRRAPDATEWKRLHLELDAEFTEWEFTERQQTQDTLVESLQEHLPPHLVAVVPRSVDVIGHVAVVELPEELAPFSHLVGKAVLETSPRIRTVMAKAGSFSSDYRVRELSLIAGEDNTITQCREHGCTFELDVRTVFFSPRLSHEHLRVASQVQPGETVVDMFAGVGPYSILIAKLRPEATVHAVELNPSASEFLLANILTNKVLTNVKPMRGDVREVVARSLRHEADRVIMNLPGKASEFLDVACLALKERGGIIHFYSFESAKGPQEAAIARLKERVESSGRVVKSALASRIVKAVAPYRVQVAVDALVC